MSLVYAVGMVRNEADVIRGTIKQLLEEGLDGILVLDNNSDDGTRDILADLVRQHPGHVHVYDDPEVGYYQSAKMSALAARAHHEFRAELIVPFDADEVWYANGDRLAVVLRALPAAIGIMQVPLWNHFATALDTSDPDPFRAMVWRQRDPGTLPKVAFRYAGRNITIHQGNHEVSGVRGGVNGGPLAIRHFPYRSPAHFVAKAVQGAAAYAATDLPYEQGAHWRSYGEIIERHGEAALVEVYERWFHFTSPIDAGMVRDPAPYRRWTP